MHNTQLAIFTFTVTYLSGKKWKGNVRETSSVRFFEMWIGGLRISFLFGEKIPVFSPFDGWCEDDKWLDCRQIESSTRQHVTIVVVRKWGFTFKGLVREFSWSIFSTEKFLYWIFRSVNLVSRQLWYTAQVGLESLWFRCCVFIYVA